MTNLAHIELDNLSISPLNMRHSKKAPDTSDILPSVRKRGILMPLLVRPNGSPTTFEVVAGRRRWFAARSVKEEAGSFPPVPCHIMAEGDDADALEASILENFARTNPDEMTQYEQFTRLIVKEGRSVEHIAATFGLTERQVQQRLALGNLLPKIREAYRAEDLDAESIRLLTMASKSQQKAWLDLYQDQSEHTPTGYQLKKWLFGEAPISTGVALFSLDGLEAEISTDLFGDDSYFKSADAFWERQSQEIAARRDAYLEAGWADVAILETGVLFETWAHEKTAKKKGGKVFIQVTARGEVTFHEGYLSRKEARKNGKANDNDAIAGADGEATKAVPRAGEVSAALQSYIDLHRHLAVRAALLDKPGVALRLLAAHALCGSRLWKVMPEPQRTGRKETDESVQASPAQALFAERKKEVLTLLDLPEGANLVATHADSEATIFARLLALSDADLRRVLTVVMAESLEAGSVYVEAAGVHLGVDMGKTWEPDDTFFELVRDKSVVSAMVADIAGKSVANANVSATGKVQKQIVKDCLAGTNGRPKVAGWLPRWMEFPVRSYKKDGGLKTAETWKGIKRLFAA
jgi:ParB family chromosome partitioning protein